MADNDLDNSAGRIYAKLSRPPGRGMSLATCPCRRSMANKANVEAQHIDAPQLSPTIWHPAGARQATAAQALDVPAPIVVEDNIEVPFISHTIPAPEEFWNRMSALPSPL